MSDRIELGRTTHSDSARTVNIETCIALLVKAMGGAVVFDSSEMMETFSNLQNGKLRIEVTQTFEPWQIKIKAVESE